MSAPALFPPFSPRHSFLVGVDSDGTVFDTMEVKQKRCFIPALIEAFHLEPVAAAVREAAELVFLASRTRGINRFPGAAIVFELLRSRGDVRESGIRIPDPAIVRAFVQSGLPLSSEGLRAYLQQTDDPDLRGLLAWSDMANREIERIVRGLPPFPFAGECLARLSERADIVVVSVTTTEALRREWDHAGLSVHVSAIAGQEYGSKREQLAAACETGRYGPDHMLMIGDAPGDYDAARAVGAQFYPIRAGSESDSWRDFSCRYLDEFLSGNYRAEEQGLVESFLASLPEYSHFQ